MSGLSVLSVLVDWPTHTYSLSYSSPRYEWDESTGRMTLLAMDALRAGSELTITYGAELSVDPRVSLRRCHVHPWL